MPLCGKFKLFFLCSLGFFSVKSEPIKTILKHHFLGCIEFVEVGRDDQCKFCLKFDKAEAWLCRAVIGENCSMIIQQKIFFFSSTKNWCSVLGYGL